jgi:multiple sugar transport system permease protein
MSRRSRSALIWAMLSPIMVLALFPYLVMVSTALKPANEVFAYPPRWFPTHLDFSNFSLMWRDAGFGTALFNSLYVSVGATIVTLLVAIPAAYGMARYSLPGKRWLYLFLLMSQMISPVVLILGIFRMMALLGLVDDLEALIFANAGFGTTFAVWMLLSYFKTIPPEIEEAARMDGANWFSMIRRVFLPMAMPAVGVTAVFIFITSWTDFVLAFTLLRSDDNLTATMKLFYLVSGTYHVAWNEVMAATLVAVTPVTIVFILLQKRIVTGLSAGAVK